MKFKMHDLVHDLALLVAQNECYSINNLPMPSKICENFRHVSLCIEEDFPPSSFELDLSNLRTLYYFPNSVWDGGANESFFRTFMPKLKFLRMFDVRCSSFEVLPKSIIGSLHHLRYLNIAWNGNLKKLPDGICKLLHLQTLELFDCWGLEELPRDIGNLINLRRLGVRANKMVPNKQIGLLSSLRNLRISNCPNLITCSSECMECIFPSLRSLRLDNCGSLRCWPGIMKHLTALEILIINYCAELNLNDAYDLSFPNLRELVLFGLPEMKDFPRWVQGSDIPSLQSLAIGDCSNLTSLPNWMQKLTYLEIWGCPKISEMSHLTSLRLLDIGSCLQLSNRCMRGGEDWHKIKHILKIRIDGEYIKTSDDFHFHC